MASRMEMAIRIKRETKRSLRILRLRCADVDMVGTGILAQVGVSAKGVGRRRD
ncbi:MAG: hypothetical protein NVS9B13_19190 [Candidatus Acidiferrum sp.]